jgi:hypothetical protein
VAGANDLLDVQDAGFDHPLFAHANEARVNAPPGGVVYCFPAS